MNDKVSSIQPNLRFGTSFLDTKYRDRAAFGETLMDKRTGEIVLKRREDGSFIYFDREHMQLNDYIEHVVSIARSNVGFKYPTRYNTSADDMNKTFLQTFVVDATNYIPENNSYTSYSSGGLFLNDLRQTSCVGNDLEEGFTFAKTCNGFYIKIMSRPRDVSIIEYASSLYNSYFENYTGSNGVYTKEREKFADKTYKDSDVTVNYTIYAYTTSGTVDVSKQVGYVKINEWGLLPFFNVNFNQSNIAYCKIIIDSIALAKMKFIPEILTERERQTYNELLDDSYRDASANDSRIAITHYYVSSFFHQDANTILPDPRNCRVLNCVGLPAFEESMRVIQNLTSGNGVIISPEEPDEQKILSASTWIERKRDVFAKGETKDLPGSPTSIKELEELFGRVEATYAIFTHDSNLENGFYVSRLGNYPNLSTLKW